MAQFGEHNYYGSSERRPAPPGWTNQWLRKICKDPKTRPPGAFKGPGRAGWLISIVDFDRWLRGRQPVSPSTVSVDGSLYWFTSATMHATLGTPRTGRNLPAPTRHPSRRNNQAREFPS